MSCRVMSRHVLSHGMSYHVLSCRGMSCPVMSCHVTSRHVPDVTACRVVSGEYRVGTGSIRTAPGQKASHTRSTGAMRAAGSCVSHAAQVRKRRAQSLSVGVLYRFLYGRNSRHRLGRVLSGILQYIYTKNKNKRFRNVMLNLS